MARHAQDGLMGQGGMMSHKSRGVRCFCMAGKDEFEW